MVGLQVMVDQVRDDLGIGLRLEHVAQRGQLLALFFMVLDDAVVYQRHAFTDVRVCIGLGHTAVGRPARVADAQSGLELFGRGGIFHFGDAAGTTYAAYLVAIQHRDARRVVAAVFQPLESFNQYWNHVAISDRSHNAAHSPSVRVW
ncbi:hypothetical protein D3C81_705340 [compost metagenome]